ncbi:nucleoside deaminase [Streptomyces sp. HD]|uniref:nucleoside deaminase n=1 Tax=Streptomyces sp. HD TaxID=3020892 RepID=UPI00232BB05F|nr:nucleoside deaminase [Streptomyces sp. HD]
MESGRREFLGKWAAAAGIGTLPLPPREPHQKHHTHPSPDGGTNTASGPQTSDSGRAGHERFMWLAIEQARNNPEWPFGAVIVDSRTGEVLAGGVNSGADSPVLHGEIVAMNDYVRRHGNQGWTRTTLYTTGEPCPMCMSAMAWADLRRVVWASSIEEIRRTGIGQIALPAQEVAARARSFYHPELMLGGVLADHTRRLFEQAQQLRDRHTDTSPVGAPS